MKPSKLVAMRWVSSIARGATEQRRAVRAAERGATCTAWPAKLEAAIAAAILWVVAGGR